MPPAAKRRIWSLRRRCHAAGWAHGRGAKSGLREKCRSGLCPSPVFSPAPCLSSPMRLPSALLRCHAPPVRDARLPSGSGHKQPVCELAWFVPVAPLHPGCSRRLRASLSAISTKVFQKPIEKGKKNRYNRTVVYPKRDISRVGIISKEASPCPAGFFRASFYR